MPVLWQSRWAASDLLKPPYRGLADRLVRLLSPVEAHRDVSCTTAPGRECFIGNASSRPWGAPTDLRMKIASWNVNSLNVRLPHLRTVAARRAARRGRLQETKLEDDEFPDDALAGLGYRSVFAGQKTYNGVAILARDRAIDDVQIGIPGFEDEQKRVIAATVGGVRIVNLYVVNGQDVGTEKYAYKLRWLEAVHDWLAQELQAHPKLVVLGDFNIAPDDRDVHDPAVWNDDHILTSTAERDGAADACRPRPARRLPPAQRRRRPVQLVGLPPGGVPPRPRPAHRPDAGVRCAARRMRRRRHRPRAAHLGTAQRPRAGMGATGARTPDACVGRPARDHRKKRPGNAGPFCRSASNRALSARGRGGTG